jgi:hypothetical protein
MGYYSRVIAYMPESTYNLMCNFKYEEPKENDGLLDILSGADITKIPKEDIGSSTSDDSIKYENYIRVEFDSIKWYDDNEDVMKFKEILESSEDYAFLRMGEEYDDVERDDCLKNFDGPQINFEAYLYDEDTPVSEDLKDPKDPVFLYSKKKKEEYEASRKAAHEALNKEAPVSTPADTPVVAKRYCTHCQKGITGPGYLLKIKDEQAYCSDYCIKSKQSLIDIDNYIETEQLIWTDWSEVDV